MVFLYIKFAVAVFTGTGVYFCRLRRKKIINPIIANTPNKTPKAIPIFAPLERFLCRSTCRGAVGVDVADFVDVDADDEVEDVLLELLELLELLLLLRLVDVELVPLVDDTRLEVPVELDVLFSGIVVDPLTITSVVPPIMVVSPDIENLESTGIVVGPSMTNSVVPPITVSEPGRPVICTPG